ncbi:MAG: hypothetical protein C0598_07830 [Marinilabiliales bacterium]|nr:MAG: hypothetical protein C0598_07830 [Marinilabiliales bacterium]
MNSANYFIEKLKLIKHPEGGWYKEVYRSEEFIDINSLDERFSSERNLSTSIFFLLEKNEFSAFHKIKSDEIWHYHSGSSLKLHMITPEGKLIEKKLGLDIENNEFPQVVVPHGYYFAAKTEGEFTLCGCTVSPGFDFSDFEMPNSESLTEMFPAQAEIISLFGV